MDQTCAETAFVNVALKKVAVSIDLPLDSMSVAEKMEAIDAIWASFCQKPGDVQSPEWHEVALAYRTRRLESGKPTVSSWADAKSRLTRLGE